MKTWTLSWVLAGVSVSLFACGDSESGTETDVASRLNRSTSSLQRDLRGEGTTFRQLLEGTRRDMAERLLTSESRSIGQTAFMLGYSDQSTFTRAFRRWHGVSPGQFVRHREGQALQA